MIKTQKVLDFETGFSELLPAIAAGAKPILVLIAGMTRSGKTYLARKSEEGIGLCSMVPLDNFFRDIDDLALPRDEFGYPIFDVPDSYKIDEFRVVLLHLIFGMDIKIPLYHLPENRVLPETKKINAGPVIIAEGLFAIQLAKGICRNAIKVFVDTDVSICLQRRIERDTALYGVSPERVRRVFEERILPYYRQFILPQKEEADFVIRSA